MRAPGILTLGFQGSTARKVLSPRTGDPGAASRPWDRACDGFVMGEGADARLGFLR